MKNNVMKVMITLAISGCCLFSAAANDVVTLESGEWTGTVFGDVGGTDKMTEENFEITQVDEDVFTLRSSNNRGKIASTSEGITFLYRLIEADSDFEFYASAEVISFDPNNQVSFGIMLRDTVYDFVFTKENLGSYIAVGPIDTTKEVANFVFMRTPDTTTVKQGDIVYSPIPVAGMVYDVIFEKSGDVYILTFGNEEPVELELAGYFDAEELYVGLFTSRNTTVTFSDVSFDVF